MCILNFIVEYSWMKTYDVSCIYAVVIKHVV